MEKPLVDKEYKLQKYPGKGGWIYASIPEVLPDKKAPFGWVVVKGFIDNHEIRNYRMMPLKNGHLFLPVRAGIRKKIGKTEGDWIRVKLFIDDSLPEIPEELRVCLDDDPQIKDTFLNYSGGEQKAFIDWITSAKTDGTKVKRISETLNLLSKGKKLKDRLTRNSHD